MFRCKSLTPVRSTHWAFERRSPPPSPYGNHCPRLLAFIWNGRAALHHRRTQLCSSGLVTSRVPEHDSTLQTRQHRVSFSLRQRSSTLSTLSTLSRESLIDDTLANPTSFSMSASAPLDTQAAASPGSSHSPLWSPTTNPPNTTRTFAFLRSINTKFQLNLSTYEDLWKWSVEHPSEFWDAVWDETDVLGVKGDAGAVSIYISLHLKLDQRGGGSLDVRRVVLPSSREEMLSRITPMHGLRGWFGADCWQEGVLHTTSLLYHGPGRSCPTPRSWSSSPPVFGSTQGLL